MEKVIINLSGSITVEVEAADAKDLIKKAAFWSSLPTNCPLCQSTLKFNYRNPQTYHYYSLVCNGTPAHESVFGEYKDLTAGFYYKGDWKDVQFGRHEDRDEPPQQQQNGQQRPAQAQPQRSGTIAEHERIEKAITAAYMEQKPSWNLDAAIKKQFGKDRLSDLTIEEKNKVLYTLTGANV